MMIEESPHGIEYGLVPVSNVLRGPGIETIGLAPRVLAGDQTSHDNGTIDEALLRIRRVGQELRTLEVFRRRA